MRSYLAALRRRLRSQPCLDLPFLCILLLLLSLGLLMLFSAGYAVALYRRGDAYTYIRPQLLFAALGLAAMYAASLVDYHIWHKLAWPIMGLSLLLLVIVLFMPEYNGCKRWIVLPGLGTLQPSEIAKFAVVLVFSHIISLNHDRMQGFAAGVLPFGILLGLVAVLMLLEPHLSGTLLILSIGAVLMFVGGTGLRWFALAGGLGVGAVFAAVLALPQLVPYAADRLSSWRDPFADPLGEGHQTIQSLYAIASGGVAGLGLGNSRQKYLYVPEPQNDFIFSILCEELGFVGAALVIFLFLLLLLRGITLAVRARDKFGALLVVGFVVQVVLQAILNIAVVTNTIPNTGISLPFFSSGGTSLLMLLGEMGIVLSVSRQTDAV
ncbi:MAG: FtsW/RodA/SpoVE family cell cycle protein [Gemmiger sp.]|uniref:FtsW/RodA/SpoVE family cell cycle protein n=1 Tax=uncultured Gemmiger sp. TaxID=1623490 RepID=UPI0027DE6B84|nr:FtsW/RodA/SpoVE family cell cycle protein [uncultured Gemmiger sp.]MDY6007160.1 FtsW/RodA/SpoVE family cell cycle protein [Gemmiger sp.]